MIAYLSCQAKFFLGRRNTICIWNCLKRKKEENLTFFLKHSTDTLQRRFIWCLLNHNRKKGTILLGNLIVKSINYKKNYMQVLPINL